MKTPTASRTRRTVIGVSIAAFFVLPGVVTAMQEYQELECSVAEFTQAVEASFVGDHYPQAVVVVWSTFEEGDWPTLQALVDGVESDAQRELCAVAVVMELGGNKAAGTRVRKQMQMIKQAAQIVRNRVLEIRSTD
jgi:hypothetical protein